MIETDRLNTMDPDIIRKMSAGEPAEIVLMISLVVTKDFLPNDPSEDSTDDRCNDETQRSPSASGWKIASPRTWQG